MVLMVSRSRDILLSILAFILLHSSECDRFVRELRPKASKKAKAVATPTISTITSPVASPVTSPTTVTVTASCPECEVCDSVSASTAECPVCPDDSPAGTPTAPASTPTGTSASQPSSGTSPTTTISSSGSGSGSCGSGSCGTVETLIVGGDPSLGSTVDATRTIRDQDVVYEFTGTGGRIRVSTCFDETTTPHDFVLQALACIPGGYTGIDFGDTSSDNLGICDENENAATYEFGSVYGFSYYVSVFPRDAGNGGEFAIQVSSTSGPVNDNSDNAIDLSVNNDFVVGSTVDATEEKLQYDVWYGFTGNGRRLQISTCSDDTTTPHNLVLQRLYKPTGGYYDYHDVSGTTATKGDYDCDNDLAAVYEFDSLSDGQYRVYVAPRNTDQTGQFAIRVTDYMNPFNDYSTSAIDLSVNDDFVVGSTVNATLEKVADDVWYNFVGNGRPLQITTCSDDTTTPHNFVLQRLYKPKGGYYNFHDVTGTISTIGDFDCDNTDAAVYEFDSIADQAYQLYVSPRNNGLTGQFAIKVLDAITSSPTEAPN